MSDLNFKKWEEYIKKPTWYFDILAEIEQYKKSNTKTPTEWKQLKREVYNFFEDYLKRDAIFLGDTGKNWDTERKSIDTIIIHHTSESRNLTLERLSAVTLFRLYAAYYANPYDSRDADVKGQPIYSHHFRNKKQVFWPYHWIVREGGKIERLLNDDEIGWQAGNWDINCRSIAIVLDNDYENDTPPDDEISAIVKIIKTNYPHIQKERVFGHREINPKTTCPSNLFLSQNNTPGWKDAILREITI